MKREVVEGETGQCMAKTLWVHVAHGFVVSCPEGAMFIGSFDVNYGHTL